MSSPLTKKTIQCLNKKVIILGAGLAGLSSAYELAGKQHEVLLLEARNRVGGRIETLRLPSSERLFAEAGACFVCQDHQWTMSYMKELLLDKNLVPFKNPGEELPVRYYTGGKLSQSLPEKSPIGAMLGKYIFGKDGKLLTELMGPIKPDDPNWPPPSLKDVSFLDFINSLSPSSFDADKGSLLPMFVPWWGELDTVSALAVRRDAVTVLYRNAPWYTLQDGMESFPEEFARRLSKIQTVKLETNARVVGIESSNSAVTVTYEQAGKRKTQSADHVICAVPFTTLRKIAVRPDFSPQKRQIIQNLPNNSVARVFLQFEKRVWHPKTNNATTFTDLKIGNLIDSTHTQPGTRGILSVYTAGANARAIQAMDERDRISYVLKEMDKIYPGITTHFKGIGASKCWDEDEWALGAYVRFTPGQLHAFSRKDIIRSEGRMHFAGDQTSPWPGWMQGALESGHRAAREIDPSIPERVSSV